MERIVYVESGAQTQRIALMEDGRLCEYLPEEDKGGSLAETILRGRVERVAPGMKAAFVQLGLEKNGFLPLEENSRTVAWPSLKAGDDVVVQVKKEPVGDKGAFLTRDVTLGGQYVVLMPLNRYIGVSARIGDTAEKTRLSALGREIAAGECGLVMRASAADASPEQIASEVAELREKWAQAERTIPTAHVPSVIYRPRTALDALLDDYLPRGITRVVTGDPDVSRAWGDKVETAVETGFQMDKVPGLNKQLTAALRRKVYLKSGGNLVIDPCEAMTVVDVNTAAFTGKKELEETVVQMNLEACAEIARQTRLRGLGGILLIDFIDMKHEESRAQVQAALEACFREDRVKTVLHGFTSLGLMEMTRKKSRLPLRERLTTVCPCCHGTGRQEERMEDETHA